MVSTTYFSPLSHFHRPLDQKDYSQPSPPIPRPAVSRSLRPVDSCPPVSPARYARRNPTIALRAGDGLLRDREAVSTRGGAVLLLLWISSKKEEVLGLRLESRQRRKKNVKMGGQ